MHYYLGPWQWVSDEQGKRWQAPPGTVGLVDLRPPFRGLIKRTADKLLYVVGFTEYHHDYGFFASSVLQDTSKYLSLGTSLHQKLGTDELNAWKASLGMTVLEHDVLVDVFVETLLKGADPTGIKRAKPLIPKLDGKFEIVLGEHGVVWDKAFEGESDEGWPNVQAVLQANYRKVYTQALADGTEHYRKYLGTLVDKYKMSEDKFIPDDLPSETARDPESEESDNFNRDDESLDVGNWNEVVGDLDIVSNAVNTAVNDENAARYETDLSSADHYGQVDYVTSSGNGGGACARFDTGGAEDYYVARSHPGSTLWDLYKKVSGGFTLLDSNAVGYSFTSGASQKCEANGSGIKGYENDVEKTSTTDTVITGNLRAGIHVWNRFGVVDNFEAADLAAAAVTGQLSLMGAGQS